MSVFNLIIKLDEIDTEAAEVYADGTIGGKKYSFILDTGSARTCVQFDDYTSTFESFQKDYSSGVFAKSNDDLITVPNIEFGPILKTNFTLARSPENSPDRRNLIGMDLLKEFCCHFYFDENKVFVDKPLDGKIYDTLQELFLDKKFHPYVDVQFGKLKTTSVWDTGAGITIVNMDFISKHPSYFQKVGQSVGTDSTGAKMETAMFTMRGLIIANNNFSPHKVAGVDLSRINSTTEVPMDLILGYSTLSKANWLFDFPQKKWAILKMLDVMN
ncbi:MAG: retropepsin-like aspartic protease [Promethearchaeota archaeon]